MAREGAVCTVDVIRKHAAVWPSLERAAGASRKGLKGLARDGRDIQRAAGVGRSDGATLAATLALTHSHDNLHGNICRNDNCAKFPLPLSLR